MRVTTLCIDGEWIGVSIRLLFIGSVQTLEVFLDEQG
jgi:hypothetical protein